VRAIDLKFFERVSLRASFQQIRCLSFINGPLSFRVSRKLVRTRSLSPLRDVEDVFVVAMSL